MDARALVESWLRGRARISPDGRLHIDSATTAATDLPAKFRRAYQWMAEHAIHTPIFDIEFDAPRIVGSGDVRVELAGAESYSSFLLLPILTLMSSRRMVIVGAPGRGKTTVATLMGLLAGHSLDDMRHAVQHGHPQLTVADLLGSPLPSELLKASDTRDVRVSWRRWISLRVKIIDEYNRIPTKTQSALLSLMAEGYAEMYEQIVRTGDSAWFLTANDDLGGGTFPVIEALKDRVDAVVRCTPFHSENLEALAERIETAKTAEAFVPADLVFSAADLDAASAQIRQIPVPPDVMDLLGFVLAQLDFCRRASDRLEFMSKDTLHVAGRRVGHVCTEDCPLDKHEHLCTQTENGASPRTMQSLIHYAKALAYFRGEPAVSTDDLRQLLPWVLHDKLRPNPQSQFFQKPENKVLLTDRASWIRQIFDRAVTQRAAYAPTRNPVRTLAATLDRPLGGVPILDLRRDLETIQTRMESLLAGNELSAPVYEDLLTLKRLWVRHQTELRRRTR